jgi:hypothetical protein
MPSGKREGRYVGSRLRETRGPRCVKHHGALLFFASADIWLLALRRMSGLQQLIFKTLSRLASARLSLETIPICRRCRSAGCLATIDP